MVTVLTKNGCVQCAAVLRRMDSKGIQHRIINMDSDPDALQHALDLGFKSAPVILSDKGNFSGYDPDRIDALV